MLRMRARAAAGSTASCRVTRSLTVSAQLALATRATVTRVCSRTVDARVWACTAGRTAGDTRASGARESAADWASSSDGEIVKCGRWRRGLFVKSCAVPLRCLPQGKHLSAAALKAKREHPQGSIVMLNSTGRFYVGSLNDRGQPHGQDSSFHADGSPEFTLIVDAADASKSGRWVDGLVNGRATFVFPDGVRFDGPCKDGLREGPGVWSWPDGRQYEGEFSADKRNGLGAKWDKHGALVECGRWADGKLVESCAVPLRLLPEKRSLSDHVKRSASLLFPDGSYFVGAINRSNQRHGSGRMLDVNGSEMQSGQWIMDRLQHRKALIIGVDKYAAPVKKLHCCVNDAIDMLSALEELAFESTFVTDANRRKMTDAITAFISSLKPGDLVFIFFSGHGAEEEGNTYLLPTDFKQGTHQHDAVGLNSILRDLNRKDCNLTNIVLDCCRSDDSNVTFKSSAPPPSARGSTSVRLPATGSFFVVNASDPGTVAHESRDDRNGWYTECLLRYLTEPGLRLTEIFMKARNALLLKSGGAQRSWDSNTLVEDIVLKPILG